MAFSTSMLVILTASSTVLPTQSSAIVSELATAVPQPKLLNLASMIRSVFSSTSQYSLTASPQLSAPKSATMSLPPLAFASSSVISPINLGLFMRSWTFCEYSSQMEPPIRLFFAILFPF